MKQMLHTPEGMRDIYNEEYAKRLFVEGKVRAVMNSFGYNDIKTPTLEFFDIFKKERGSVSTQEMFKLFDSDNNTLVLRPDMTPSIVRCVSKYYTYDELPVRICYQGNTFINDRKYRLRLKECADAGAELFGDDSVTADAEMIACCIECLKAAGLKDIQISVGSAAFLSGLFEEIGFSEEIEADIRRLLIAKNFFALDTLLQKENLTARQKEVFARLNVFNGNISQVLRMEALVKNEKAREAVRRLKALNKILGYYGLSRYISYDLGMMTSYQYYTGIIFSGYTYGIGNAIVSGGRYDTLMKQFNYDAPAVGFKISMDSVMTALDRQGIETPVSMTDGLVILSEDEEARGIALATALRKKGLKVASRCCLSFEGIDDYINYAKKNKMKKVYAMTDEDTVIIYDINGNSEKVAIASLMEE